MRLHIVRRGERKGETTLGFGGSSQEDALARFVIAEYRRGRTLASILDDPYLRNRADPTARQRLLDRGDVIAAIGSEVIASLGGTRAGAAAR